jgi:serine/threonine protein kinase
MKNLNKFYDLDPEPLLDNSAYSWLKAKDKSSGDSVVLQIPKFKLAESHKKALESYFGTLRKVAKKRDGLLAPQIFDSSHPDHPLIFIYQQDLEGESLATAIAKCDDSESALSLWHDVAFNNLFHLHNEKLVHGYLTPESIVLDRDRNVHIRYFGYAPLLAMNCQTANDDCAKYAAPEVLIKGEITPAADIYCLAQLIMTFHPELKGSDWFKQATAPKPRQRHQNMRLLFYALETALTAQDNNSDRFLPVPVDRKSPHNGNGNRPPKRSGIRPKECTLSLKILPPLGGKAQGAGTFAWETEATIKAIPNSGYEFKAWDGEVRDRNAPTTTVTLDTDQEITAYFVRTEANYDLNIIVKPSGAAKVKGAGTYPAGTLVEIKVTDTTADYQFHQWFDDTEQKVLGNRNSITVPLQGNKTIIAQLGKERKVNRFINQDLASVIYVGDRAVGKTHLALRLAEPDQQRVEFISNIIPYAQLKASFGVDEATGQPEPTGALLASSPAATSFEAMEVGVELPRGYRKIPLNWVDTPGELWDKSWQSANMGKWQDFLPKIRSSRGIMLVLQPCREMLLPTANVDLSKYLEVADWQARFRDWVNFFRHDCPSARHIVICLNKADLICHDLAAEAQKLSYDPHYSEMSWYERHAYVCNRYLTPLLPQLAELNRSISGSAVMCFITSIHNRQLLELPWIYLASYLD